MVLLAAQKSLINKRQMISVLSRGQNYSDLEPSKSETSRVCQKFWVAKWAFPQNSFEGSSSVDNWSGYIYCFPGLDLVFCFSCTKEAENQPLQKTQNSASSVALETFPYEFTCQKLSCIMQL